jgi:hypothetical protein
MYKMPTRMQTPTTSFLQQQKHEETRTVCTVALGPRAHKHKRHLSRPRKRLGPPIES